MRKIYTATILLLCSLVLIGCKDGFRNMNVQLEHENKYFKMGMSNAEAPDEDDFFAIRMDVRFSSPEEFQRLFEPQHFNYIMNDVCGDFKFITPKDTISCLNNFANFNKPLQTVSFVCLFPKEIEEAKEFLLQQNCFLNQAIQKEI